LTEGRGRSLKLLNDAGKFWERSLAEDSNDGKVIRLFRILKLSLVRLSIERDEGAVAATGPLIKGLAGCECARIRGSGAVSSFGDGRGGRGGLGLADETGTDCGAIRSGCGGGGGADCGWTSGDG